MTVCTCKENGRRYGDVQWDTRGCPLHCEHPGINTLAPQWVCSCGASYGFRRETPPSPRQDGEAEQNNTRRPLAQET